MELPTKEDGTKVHGESTWFFVTGKMISDICRFTISRESGSRDICNHEVGLESRRTGIEIRRRVSERKFEHGTKPTALIVAFTKLVSVIRQAFHNHEHLCFKALYHISIPDRGIVPHSNKEVKTVTTQREMIITLIVQQEENFWQ